MNLYQQEWQSPKGQDYNVISVSSKTQRAVLKSSSSQQALETCCVKQMNSESCKTSRVLILTSIIIITLRWTFKYKKVHLQWKIGILRAFD